MDIEKILAEAPEGATHFEYSKNCACWYKYTTAGYEVWMQDNKAWRLMPDYCIECPADIHSLQDLREIQKLRAENSELKAALKTALRHEKQWYEGDYLKESQLAKGGE